MAKYTLPDFVPDLRVVTPASESNRLVLAFDTATDIDLFRSPRVLIIDTEGVSSITIAVDGLEYVDSVIRRYVIGEINLLTSNREGEQKRHLLSQFKLVIESDQKPDKDGSYHFPPESEIEQLVRQGVADAFADASVDMVVDRVPVAHVAGQPFSNIADTSKVWASRSQASLEMRGATKSTKSRMSKKMMFFLGTLALLLVVGVVKIIAAPASDPVQAAVNRALASDPRARDEQIEITRQTLKEMGLDPGKNGDLGCLVGQ